MYADNNCYTFFRMLPKRLIYRIKPMKSIPFNISSTLSFCAYVFHYDRTPHFLCVLIKSENIITAHVIKESLMRFLPGFFCSSCHFYHKMKVIEQRRTKTKHNAIRSTEAFSIN